jgi:predicted transcriptional regulator of viral defense system
MLANLIKKLAESGRTTFTTKDIHGLRQSSSIAVMAALRRLEAKGEIVTLHRGLFAIVPPEYRSLACIPAEQFIPDLMEYLQANYYVALLSAAEYHGAAHQRPQLFQVMVNKALRPVKCGRVGVQFLSKKTIEGIPTQSRNTPAGIIRFSTPEATAFDLVGYAGRAGGIDNVATVLTELHEKINADVLVSVSSLFPIVWAQRLGYLLDSVGAGEKAERLAAHIKDRAPVRVSLVPGIGIKKAIMNRRWRLFINTAVEADI